MKTKPTTLGGFLRHVPHAVKVTTLTSQGLVFFDGPVGWQKVVDALNRAGDRGEPTGLDTEFTGFDWATGTAFDFDPRDITTIGRTRVHVWSVAVLLPESSGLDPRGFRLAHPAVLPEAALDFPPARDWLESDRVKCAHNLPADAHTLGNHGVDLGGGRDTLAVARWCWPERAAMQKRFKPYALKTLAAELLGYTDVMSFESFLTEPNVVPVTRTVSLCVCMIEGCRKRKVPHGQYKAEVTDYVERGRKAVPLREIGPGHPLWEKYLQYAAYDAQWSLELSDLAQRQNRRIPQTW